VPHIVTALCALLLVLWPAAAVHAHEKWFVEHPEAFPLQLDRAAVQRSAAAFATGAAGIGAAFVLERLWNRRRRRPSVGAPDLAKSKADLMRLLAWMPVILAFHAAAPLIVSGVQRELFVPNLALPRTFFGGAVALAEIVVALGFVYGVLTRPAALVLVALFPVGMLVFGPVEIMEHVHLMGIALFFFIMGRGLYSFDGLTDVPRPRVRRWIPHAVPALRLLAGLSIVWVGFTEKLWNVPLGLAFLERHPLNFMPSLGFREFSDADFVIAAGMTEVAMGMIIASGLVTRLVIVAAWVPFNLSLPFLGWVELVGHLPIYGIMAVLLLWGGKRDVRGYVREMEAAAEAG
jgi:hypothetical protein